jgi:hypothetical protein
MLINMINSGVWRAMISPDGEGFEGMDGAFSDDFDGVVRAVACVAGEAELFGLTRG